MQAVIVAADVQPKALVAHFGALCASRGVVMLPISGGDGSGSLKLGEVLGTRTAIAIGIKVSVNLSVLEKSNARNLVYPLQGTVVVTNIVSVCR